MAKSAIGASAAMGLEGSSAARGGSVPSAHATANAATKASVMDWFIDRSTPRYNENTPRATHRPSGTRAEIKDGPATQDGAGRTRSGLITSVRMTRREQAQACRGSSACSSRAVRKAIAFGDHRVKGSTHHTRRQRHFHHNPVAYQPSGRSRRQRAHRRHSCHTSFP
jgi:hypothetical protein